jgi:murein DD-endopeptidase MepM/ murein hydrolase activator NlpD
MIDLIILSEYRVKNNLFLGVIEMKKRIVRSISRYMLIIMVFTILSIGITAKTSHLKNNNIKYLNTSLGIDIKNIDMSTIHDINPMDTKQIQQLSLYGYRASQMEKMDYGDYKKIKAKQNMSEKRIKYAKNIYPELTDVNMSEWTNEKYEQYITTRNDELFKPNNEQLSQFKKRQIELDDARYLLKIYHSYDNILDQSDETLREHLEKLYIFKLKYLNDLNSIELANLNSKGISMNSYAIPESKKTKYTYVSGLESYAYGNGDWFHNDTQTHIDDNASFYMSQAHNIHRAIYGNVTPRFTNLWGTYSSSQGGAHEGIDMCPTDGPYQPPLKSVVNGTVIGINTSVGKVVIKGAPAGYDQSFFYYHMSSDNVDEDEIVYSGITTIGNEGSKGNSTGDHLHFAVEDGITTSTGKESDDRLTSENPYLVLLIN